MSAMKTRRLRISRCRGREYIQFVVYTWDSSRKRNRTIVLQHLGPLERVEKERPDLALQINRLRKRTGLIRYRPSRRSSVRLKVNRDSYGKLEQDLDDFQTRVLSLVRGLPAPIGRKALFRLAQAERLQPVDRNHNLSDDIGKVLTNLHRWGFLTRRGDGGVHYPYRYWSQ